MLALLFIMGLQPLSAQNRLKVINDSINLLGNEIRPLKDRNKVLLDSINAVTSLINRQDSIISDINSQIEIARQTIDSKDIKGMEAEIKNLKDEIDSNSGNFIVIATNFLYVPYNQDNVSVALATYDLAKESEVYNKYSIRQKLLKNYKTDTEKLKKFLEANTKNKITMLNLGAISNAFNNLEPVKQYPQYGNGWKELYLGSIINEIKGALTEAIDPKNAVDLDKVFNDNLKKLR